MEYSPQIPDKKIDYAISNAASLNTGKHVKLAFYAAILFFILSNQNVYMFIGSLYSMFTSSQNELASDAGCPTLKGNIVHSFLMFILLIILVSYY